MTSYAADTTPKKGGFLSRLFDTIAESYEGLKQSLEAIDRETEWQRIGLLEFYALGELEGGASDEDTLKNYMEFLDKEKDSQRFGKIDAGEILLMKQQIASGEYTPQYVTSGSKTNEPATLEA